jgi:cell division inhibitor SepF
MVEGLLKRTKAFFGLEDDQENALQSATQMDMTTFLKGSMKRDNGHMKEREDAEYEIVVFEPKAYEDSINISAYLRKGSAVIINLRNLEQVEGTRLVDFVCGTAYAIDGHMQKIGETIFLFTPKRIAVSDLDERPTLGEEINLTGKRELFFENR